MIQSCSSHDLTLLDPWFDGWFGNIWLMIRPCSHLLTLFDSWFDTVRPMTRPRSILSVLLNSWLDPVQPMNRPCSTHVLTLFNLRFDPVWFYRPCSTHDLTLRPIIRFSLTLSTHAQLMIWPCSTYDLSLFESIDPAQLMIRLCLTILTQFDRWFNPWFDFV